jgi:hypothetical protein
VQESKVRTLFVDVSSKLVYNRGSSYNENIYLSIGKNVPIILYFPAENIVMNKRNEKQTEKTKEFVYYCQYILKTKLQVSRNDG